MPGGAVRIAIGTLLGAVADPDGARAPGPGGVARSTPGGRDRMASAAHRRHLGASWAGSSRRWSRSRWAPPGGSTCACRSSRPALVSRVLAITRDTLGDLRGHAVRDRPHAGAGPSAAGRIGRSANAARCGWRGVPSTRSTATTRAYSGASPPVARRAHPEARRDARGGAPPRGGYPRRRGTSGLSAGAPPDLERVRRPARHGSGRHSRARAGELDELARLGEPELISPAELLRRPLDVRDPLPPMSRILAEVGVARGDPRRADGVGLIDEPLDLELRMSRRSRRTGPDSRCPRASRSSPRRRRRRNEIPQAGGRRVPP